MCQELSVGGITPSYGLIEKVLNELSIPTTILIRPRSGNFVHTDDEFQIMKSNIQRCKELGAKGIVSGVLDEDNTIDIARTKELVALSKPLPFTFHRAFDEVQNPKAALEQLIDLDVVRVLTSGQQKTAEEGLPLLAQLNQQAKGRIVILAGGGISSENAIKFKNAGIQEIHASASSTIQQEKSMFGMHQTVSDTTKIKAILNAI